MAALQVSAAEMGDHEVEKEQSDSTVAGEDQVSRSRPSWSPPVGATRSGLGLSKTQSSELALARTLHSGNMGGDSAAPGPSAPEVAEPLPVGAIVGERYRIEEHISSGGFGAVYRAADKEIHHHQVALKLLHAPAADDEARGDAMRELALIASVSHPSVVQFKDYGWHEGRLWFAMPWYQGKTLDQRYAGSSMTRAEARPLFERLAQGLAAMHAVGVHHHDIKPENIFVAEIAGFEGGLPVLLDLGIATRRGEVPKGFTLDYAAPETAAAALGEMNHPIGAAADVFALALVLRNMLEPESQTFTEDAAMLSFLHTRATKALKPPKRKDCRYLSSYFQRWLHLDPAKRPTASEFAAELACLTQPEEQRAARMRILKRVAPIVLLAAGIVALLWTQMQRQEQEIQKQQGQLEDQMRESAVLRETSEEQLQKLESQDQQLGDQRAQLSRAIGIARQLSERLETSENSRIQGVRKIRALTDERDKISGERDKISAERDQVTKERDQLSAERDQLVVERDGLTAQRESLEAERESLTKIRDELAVKLKETTEARDALQGKHDELTLRADTLQQELDSSRQELQTNEEKRASLEKRLQTSDEELATRTAVLKDLNVQKQALESREKELSTQLEQTKEQVRDLKAKLKAAKAKKKAAPASDSKPAAPSDSP